MYKPKGLPETLGPKGPPTSAQYNVAELIIQLDKADAATERKKKDWTYDDDGDVDDDDDNDGDDDDDDMKMEMAMMMMEIWDLKS